MPDDPIPEPTPMDEGGAQPPGAPDSPSSGSLPQARDRTPPQPSPGPTPTGFQRTQSGGFRWQPPTVEHLGKLLPQYEIERLLGHGGMGAVYKGNQKSLDRPVAIKILPPGLDDEDASYVERFKNEARVMAKFMHPAIVGVFDFGETSEGQLYIVMEFVDGTDVQKMIQQQGRLPPEHALAVTAHVCDALQYAHTHGVIHRDIKPANVLINMEGAVKVADFGLAKTEEAGGSGLTKTGMAMGTPDFVAPETLMLGVNIDGRADLYAVGVMLYNMLTGNVPRGAFKPVSVMLPGTDPRFDHIVQKAMQMDREERYQTAAEIRRDLDVILTTPMVQAGGQSSAAIPKQAIPGTAGLRPAPGDSQSRAPRKAVAPATNPQSEIANRKSKLPLLIGIAAAAVIAVGAFVTLRSGSRQTSDAGSQSSASTSANGGTLARSATGGTAPIKVREDTKPGSGSRQTSDAGSPASAPAPANAGTLASSATGGTAPIKVRDDPKPAAPISNLKSPISNAAPAAFPPGQWVKVLTKFEELPEELRTPNSGVKFENGWCVVSRDNVLLKTDAASMAQDSAIRARIRWGKDDVPLPRFQLRSEKVGSGLTRAIRLHMQIGGRFILIKESVVNGKPAHETLNEGKLSPPPKAGDEIVMELAVHGSRVVGRVNSNLVVAKYDESRRGPLVYYTGLHPIRDIEVINLDGIPEAEALRILGVDEKGNDLRALAAKQEQQKAEQAKQASAIAAIPELKALHEQFVKLQAERVSAPFEKDVAALNTSYLGGLEREIEKEKKAGRLDGVIALEAEKKLIAAAVAGGTDPGTVAGVYDPKAVAGVYDPGGGAQRSGTNGSLPPPGSQSRATVPGSQSRATTMPLPAEDADTTPANLKALRQIYRDTFAKHEATHTANLKLLTDPLSNRLKLLESSLTQKNRIEHARTVREYREGLGTSGFQPERPAGVPPASSPPGGTPGTPTAGTAVLQSSPLPAATKDNPFINSLGMKFVPVPGADVLFCIYETRRQDYAAYANEVPGVDGSWKNQQRQGIPCGDKDEHPVCGVSWEDAQRFCEWLSKKEGRTYRLPTDEEWSIAVGLGRKEKHGKGITPEMLSQREQTVFPWEDDFPPKTKDQAGNYADESWHEKLPLEKWMEKYSDGYATTAPVMSFKPNKAGLYDMGGNVREWVEDWLNAAQKERVLRGAEFSGYSRGTLLASFRHRSTPGYRDSTYGFRVVLEQGK